MNSIAESPRKLALRQSANGLALVAFCFSLFVIVEMYVTWGELLESRPVDHPMLIALRADLGREPGADMIKEAIRLEELKLRALYLTAFDRLQEGAWLLLIGIAACAAGVKLSIATWPRIPALATRELAYDPDHAPSILGRASLAGLCVLLVGAAFTLPLLGERNTALESASGVWARFRGAGGRGISEHPVAPLEIDARSGEERNLRWKSVVPLPGLSSPVVWNERVFLTGASPNNREVYCFDALSGALLWREPVSAGPESSIIPENIWSETGYAAPTPVTDGKHVWALFANGDVVCLDVFGQEKWCLNLGTPDNMYGLAASPLLMENKLILQLDQEWGEDEAMSALIALDLLDGSELWRTPREVGSSWPSPIPIETPRGALILTCANPFVIAYEPEGGEEVWRVDRLAGDGGPSPSATQGLVFAVNIGSPLTAIRSDGEGDVTDTHIAWEYDDRLPDVCSLLTTEELLWMLSTDGLATCLEASTGAPVWERDFEADFYSSPILAAGRLYLIGRKGEIFVLAAGREARELWRGEFGEECDTSPAFAGGRLYVRGRRQLFCFEEEGS